MKSSSAGSTRQIEAANQMLSQEALSDALTNLGNRNRFEKTIQAFEFDKQGKRDSGLYLY
ncbi:MAG: hypothetical protein ACLTW9_00570 [Enterocloster sp.]